MIDRTSSSSPEVSQGRQRTRSIRLMRVLTAAALAVAALGAGAGSVLAYGPATACTSPALATVFAPWGDTANYFQVSNGGFENGSTDWALTGSATIVGTNEPWKVAGASDSHSLNLAGNGAAESRTFCVSKGQDVIRLFVANPHVSGAILHVDTTVVNPDNGYVGTSAFDVNGDPNAPAWAPTIALKIPALFNGSGMENLTLRFSLRGSSASWKIDDVFVDPFKSW
jgi:hypothetical protein